MSDNINNAYMSYQAMVSQTNQGMANLSDICNSLGLNDYVNSLEGTRERMQNKTFSVGIMGEFKRGKSTVINALLGQEIVPSDIVPTSATLNYVCWDTKPGAVVHFKDGTKKEIAVEQLSDYVTKITAESEQMAASVEDAVVYYPCTFCQNGVQIVDTPGLNDDERMNKISEEVIPTLDAIIMVIVPDAPFSMSEAEFVRSKVMTSDLGRIVFIVNKIDAVRKKDREKIINHIKESIQKSVLGKIADMYGEDSDEYKEAKNKLADVRIFGISARDALEGRLDNDEELIEESGILAFERSLSRLLTEERGMLELVAPVNSIISIAKEARKTIAIRRDALNLDKEELERITSEAMQTVTENREKKKKAVEDLKNRSSDIYSKLLPELNAAYDDIERLLLEYVEQIDISLDDVKNNTSADKRAEQLSQEIIEQSRLELAKSTEILLTKIKSYTGDDIVTIKNLSSEICSDIIAVQGKLTKSNNDKLFDWGIVAANTLLTNFNPLFGIGGVFSGWKENGIKGAVLGGIAGAAAGGAAAYASLLVCGTVLGMATVSALPIMLIAGVASTFGGKAAVRTIFHKSIRQKNIQKLRSSLNVFVKETRKDIQSKRVLENWLRDATNEVYTSIARNVDQEVEATLTGFENTLMQLRLDKQKKESDIAQIISDMDKLDNKLEEISDIIMPVKSKLTDALSPEKDTATV